MTKAKFLFAEIDKVVFWQILSRNIIFKFNPMIFFNKSSRWPLFLPDNFHFILKADWQAILPSNKQTVKKKTE